MHGRINRIFSFTDADAFIIHNGSYPGDINFFYASGINSGAFEDSTIIAHRNGTAVLLTSALEEEIARKETKLDVYSYFTREERRELIRKFLPPAGKIGINGSAISYNHYKAFSKIVKGKLYDVSAAFAAARSVKGKKEIQAISRACKISAQAVEELPAMVKAGMTEAELARKLVVLMYEKGATGMAFPPIVAFGSNSSRPHHTPTERKLKRNEFVLADFGAEFNRYASDITRTFVFGRATGKMRQMYDTVKEAQAAAMDFIKEGEPAKEADIAARKIIDKKFPNTFIHSLGHEVGMKVHDGKGIGSYSDFVFNANMAVTNEPGIYLPSVGGVRIEDTLLVQKAKPKILTSAGKELVEIS